jgi:hypothetical protein
MPIRRHKIMMAVSILLESPFYLTIPTRERYLLLEKLLEDYPNLFEKKDEEDEF